ncbi:MAG: YkgJ family cysteine cluster protein [Bryobacteraceae bacterium]
MREPAVSSGDRRLIQIVDAAMEEAVRRSGAWVACRPGCTQCCIGPFAINQLDARRLRAGLAELRATDPPRADHLERRANAFVARWSADFPGDPVTGLLADEDFPDFAEDVPCPALDPEQGTCDLYEARPMTCRVFGPAVLGEDGVVGACELCYVGADDRQIEACSVEVDPGRVESSLSQELEPGLTTVAWCLSSAR